MLKFILFFLSLNISAFSEDLGYRYKDGKCVNEKGQQGLNPKTIGQCGDLSYVQLSGINMSPFDLSGSNFSNSVLEKTVFSKTKLRDINFEGANLKGAFFSNSELKSVLFKNADLSGATFADAVVEDADFSKTLFRNTQLSFKTCDRCNFDEAYLDGSEIFYAQIKSSSFKNTRFENVQLEEVQILDTNMQKLGVSNSFIVNTTFSNCDLAQSTLLNTGFPKSIFKEINFKSANFLNAVMLESKFISSIFTDSYFTSDSKFPFSREEALKLGMKLVVKPKALVYSYDRYDPYISELLKGLSPFDITKIVNKGEGVLDIPANLAEYSFILFSARDSSNNIKPDFLQKMMNFVKAGGTFFSSAGFSYAAAEVAPKGLVLLPIESGLRGSLLNIVPEDFSAQKSPELMGVSQIMRPSTVEVYVLGAGLREEQDGFKAEVLLRDTSSNQPALVKSGMGKGLIYQVGFFCDSRYPSCSPTKDIIKIYQNTVLDSMLKKMREGS